MNTQPQTVYHSRVRTRERKSSGPDRALPHFASIPTLEIPVLLQVFVHRKPDSKCRRIPRMEFAYDTLPKLGHPRESWRGHKSGKRKSKVTQTRGIPQFSQLLFRPWIVLLFDYISLTGSDIPATSLCSPSELDRIRAAVAAGSLFYHGVQCRRSDR